jgi:hypothetical protein
MDRLMRTKHLFCVLSLVFGASALSAQSPDILYTFSPTANNYQQGPTGLVADANGNLYGILEDGGNMTCAPAGCGQIYELASPGGSFGSWTSQILYQFTGGSDGCSPSGQMAIDASGALYGVANGASCSQGTIFKLTRSSTGLWQLQTIYSGSGWNAVLALDPNGNVYATQIGSGVFEFEKPQSSGGAWTVEQIATVDGELTGGLEYFNGKLYGTTSNGGSGFGSVFELTSTGKKNPTWSVANIATFNGGTDGSGPSYFTQLGLSVAKAGLIFGVTQGLPPCAEPGDCGTVYELQKQSGGSWLRTVIHSFDGTDGALPMTVTASSNGEQVFGTTFEGTGVSSAGNAFVLSAPTTSAASWNLRAFDFSEWNVVGGGGYPFGNVVIDADGLGVYLTPQGADSVLDVQGLITVGAPFKAAGNTGERCIDVSYPRAGDEVKFTNVCSRRVDFWSCAQNSAPGSNACSPIIDLSVYQANFLDSNRTATLNISTEPGLGVVGNALECPAGQYPVLYTDTLGNQHLDCGNPQN